MKYISIFSGIEAASVAWEKLGWQPLSFSEIDPFPKAVLARHYPEVPDLGDITKIDWSGYVGSANVVVGGSPCQSFSIAGSRTGLDGASGLMWEYVRAVRELRPEWFVWENVPGALSSSNGEDFRCLLASMDELGYGLAWRVLDAQFFGVAQRRRRVFLVGHLGDQRAAEVLFEPESLRWDTPSSREKRQALTRRTENSARTAGKSISWNRHDGRCTYSDDTSLVQTLSAHMGTGGDNVPPIYQTAGDFLTPWDTQSRRIYRSDGVMSTLDARTGKAGADAKAVYIAQEGSSSHRAAVMLRMRSGCAGGGKGALVSDELSLTLATGNDQTLFSGPKVRRLTPLECERLQGFPDGWTDIPYRGKTHAPDSARYKALGNSMAVPVMRWIGRRIGEAPTRKAVME